MVLTDDGQLQAQISNPRFKQRKTYLAQIEGIPSEEDLAKLADGIELKDGMTRPAEVSRIEEPSFLWERNPPIRSRKTVQDCWISLTITEGRNRQVRRMTAAIGHPTLRLVRQRVGDWTLDGIKPGEFRLIETKSKPMPKHRPKRPKFLKSHSR